jgi:hypothetical protein
MAAWAQWVWSSTHWCWECSTLSTGGAELAPSGEWALRWRDWSALAYMEPQWRLFRRSGTRELKTQFFYLSFFLCLLFKCFASRHPSSCVSPDARGWSLYLTQLGGFVSRQRWFSWKSWKLGYSRHYIAVFTHLKVRALMSLGENFLFFRKKYFWEKNISDKRIFWKKYFKIKNISEKKIKNILIIFFERKILRVESCRAYTHVHRRGKGAVSVMKTHQEIAY